MYREKSFAGVVARGSAGDAQCFREPEADPEDAGIVSPRRKPSPSRRREITRERRWQGLLTLRQFRSRYK